MAINFAKLVIIASLICGSITYITCLDGNEYYELPTVVRSTLTDAEKNQVILWTSSIMENKTTDAHISETLAADLKKAYAGNWIVISGAPTYTSSVSADNVKILVLTYQTKKIVVWNSNC
jgi:hypothetical protein